jgi:tellurite resistance protein TerB
MELLGRLRDPFAAGARRARDKTFLEAAMAATAFVAATDEAISLARRHTLDDILDTVDRLQAFEIDNEVNLFDDYVPQFRSAPERTEARALKAVSALAGQSEAVYLLLRIAAAIARAEVSDLLRSLGLTGARAGRA